MTRCPTCGGPWSARTLLGSEELYALLKNGQPHREVYRGRDGGWWITYGGGEVDPSAVQTLVQRGLIASVYSNIPDEVYHVGPTIDCNATMERRRGEGNKAPLIYIEAA